MVQLHLAQDRAADQLLSKDPFALLIGMVLDQQIPLEKAFAGPRILRERLGGTLGARRLAEMGEAELAAAFSERPALHRFPGAMAARVQQLAIHIVEGYGGDAAKIWKSAATGDELLRRLKALPGFGDQKARIFLALLGKQLGVRPAGWQQASSPYGEPGSRRSVADIEGPESLAFVRQQKREMKLAAREIARPDSGSGARIPKAAGTRRSRAGTAGAGSRPGKATSDGVGKRRG